MDDDANMRKSSNWFWRVYKPVIEWVNRHINWSMLIGYGISATILSICITNNVLLLNIILMTVNGIIAVWGLLKKNRSLWFALLAFVPVFFIIPIVIEGKKNGQNRRKNDGELIQTICVMGREFEVGVKQPKDKNLIDDTKSGVNEIESTRG